MSENDFRAVFFEEAAEHLQTIEDELLTLDANPGDSEALNSVFRAAHSIKGSAGMFGFNTLADFTHHLETLLDLVRKGQAVLDDDRVELTLQAVDEIRAIVDRLRGGEETPPADAGLTRALVAAVATALGDETASDDSSGADDNGFGLFEDLPDEPDESFSLFDDNPGQPSQDDQEPGEQDDSFGLFTDGDVATDPGRDDGFGFFEQEDESSDSAASTACASWFDEMFTEGEGHGPAPSMDGQNAANAGTENSPGEVGDTKPEQHSDDPETDGGFGWLNRPETDPEPEPRAPVRTSRPARRGNDRGGSLRVSLEKVDELVNQISELVITRAMLQETADQLDPAANERHLATLEVLERNTRELQESVLSIRLLPVSFLFSRFPRVVRDLSRKMGKQVKLIQLGEQTELDKSLIEKLADPLTHLVRNSIDHGVEMPGQRVAAGKPEKGQVIMTAEHQGGNIMIAISDDGAGMDRDRILAKARSNGIEVSDDWSDDAVFNLIFEPGFSTAAEVTDISGRGVGMDVVRRNIRELGGTVEVESRLGEGSRFTVRLPLTLAITDGMVVRVGEERYVLPLATVVESLQLTSDDIHEVQGRARVIHRHGDYLSLLDLAAILDPARPRQDGDDNLAVVVESEGRQVALLVDELVGQQQIVIKNLESNYRRVDGFSGATVMGDGAVAFILDVSHFVARSDSGRDAPVITPTNDIPD